MLTQVLTGSIDQERCRHSSIWIDVAVPRERNCEFLRTELVLPWVDRGERDSTDNEWANRDKSPVY